jgi:anaerobic nitric oxide reductase flavorubredoxin
MKNLKSLSIQPEDIDYIILNHLEPDHTGFTYMFRSIAPNAQIVTTKKGADLVDGFYGIKENIKTVETGDSVDLGNGKVLHFTEIPNVHWPETMVTYEQQSKILFSSDAFGSFGIHKGSIFDDKQPEAIKPYWEDQTLRYYANIVATFSSNVLNAIEKLSGVDISMVAPSHGLIWRGSPNAIINKYVRYANYSKDFQEPEITIIWGSMYGNTETMLHSILNGVAELEIPVHVHQVPNENPSFILRDVFKSAGLIIGCPTYEYGMFPPMKYVMELLKEKIMRFKKVGFFGSFGWSGGAKRDFDELKENMKWDIEEPLLFKGYPSDEEREKGEELGRTIASKIKEIPSKIKNEDY